MKKERVAYFDYLRVFATLSVIVLHTAIQFWFTDDPRGMAWNIANLYSCFVRWGVPIFLMISGALFLSREIPTKTLYTKYIPRMMVSFLIWSAIYVLVSPWVSKLFGFKHSTTTGVIQSILSGYYHMWYIPMIIGIYMCLPVIRQIVKSETVTRYFLALVFVFAFAIPQVTDIAGVFFPGRIARLAEMCYKAIAATDLFTISGFVLYFVCGYLVSRRELSQKQRRVIYALGAMGFVFTVALSTLGAWLSKKACEDFFYATTVNVFFSSLAVFVWFRHHTFDNEKQNRLVAKLSQYSFGVYLVHIFVLETLYKMGLQTKAFANIVSIPVVAIVVAVISYLISWALNKLPLVKKWMV